MFRELVVPILRSIVQVPHSIERRLYKIAGIGESIVEERIGEKVLAIPGIELGYCARPGEVDVRMLGEPDAIERADTIVRSELGLSIFSTSDETLEEVLVKLLTERKETLAHRGILHRWIARQSDYERAGRLQSFRRWLRRVRKRGQDQYARRR